MGEKPPTLIISGPDMGHAVSLLRLLGCVCRRSLMLADINKRDRKPPTK
jgi:hypothetical protein